MNRTLKTSIKCLAVIIGSLIFIALTFVCFVVSRERNLSHTSYFYAVLKYHSIIYLSGVVILNKLYKGNISRKQRIKSIIFVSALLFFIFADTFYYYWRRETDNYQITVDAIYEVDKNSADIVCLREDIKHLKFPDPKHVRSIGDIVYDKDEYIYLFCDACEYLGWPIDPHDTCFTSLYHDKREALDKNSVNVYKFKLDAYYKYAELDLYAKMWDKENGRKGRPTSGCPVSY